MGGAEEGGSERIWNWVLKECARLNEGPFNRSILKPQEKTSSGRTGGKGTLPGFKKRKFH